MIFVPAFLSQTSTLLVSEPDAKVIFVPKAILVVVEGNLVVMPEVVTVLVELPVTAEGTT